MKRFCTLEANSFLRTPFEKGFVIQGNKTGSHSCLHLAESKLFPLNSIRKEATISTSDLP